MKEGISTIKTDRLKQFEENEKMFKEFLDSDKVISIKSTITGDKFGMCFKSEMLNSKEGFGVLFEYYKEVSNDLNEMEHKYHSALNEKNAIDKLLAEHSKTIQNLNGTIQMQLGIIETQKTLLLKYNKKWF